MKIVYLALKACILKSKVWYNQLRFNHCHWMSFLRSPRSSHEALLKPSWSPLEVLLKLCWSSLGGLLQFSLKSLKVLFKLSSSSLEAIVKLSSSSLFKLSLNSKTLLKSFGHTDICISWAPSEAKKVSDDWYWIVVYHGSGNLSNLVCWRATWQHLVQILNLTLDKKNLLGILSLKFYLCFFVQKYSMSGFLIQILNSSTSRKASL